jgi:hypothetical protein
LKFGLVSTKFHGDGNFGFLLLGILRLNSLMKQPPYLEFIRVGVATKSVNFDPELTDFASELTDYGT